MTEVTTNGGAMSRSSDELVTYTVQVMEEATRDGDDRPVRGWFDVATVSVPPRTKRRTVIEHGLAEAEIEKTPDLEARLLDGGSESNDSSEAAYIWRPKPPEPAALRLT